MGDQVRLYVEEGEAGDVNRLCVGDAHRGVVLQTAGGKQAGRAPRPAPNRLGQQLAATPTSRTDRTMCPRILVQAQSHGSRLHRQVANSLANP